MILSPTTTTRDLWSAVDHLTRPRRVKLPNDGIFERHITLPSLWAQLAEAIDKNTGDSGNGKQQSRPPLNTEAISLLIEIAQAVRDERRARKLKAPFDTPAELRAIINDAIRKGDHPYRNTTAWAHLVRLIGTWCSRIEALTEHTTLRLYGAACRTCGALTVPAFDTDGIENGRQPALVVHFLDGEVLTVECDMCGSVLDATRLNQLWHELRLAASKSPLASEDQHTA